MVPELCWRRYWAEMDAFLVSQDIVHFSAREISPCSIVYSPQGPISNKQAPRSMWPHIIPTLGILEIIRAHFDNQPIYVGSGYRASPYNKAIGGAPKSQHVQFRACDVHMDYIRPREIWNYLTKNDPPRNGYGVYKTFIHVDTRSTSARWERD